MNQDANKLTCAEFQAQLPELIGTGIDISTHPHVQTCDLCRALLADLETIASAARELFPIADPPDDLWQHIESAIMGGEPSQPIESEQQVAQQDEVAASGPKLSAEPVRSGRR